MISTIGGYSQAARKGVSGLATGLDTDEIVKGMTLSTRTKIAKQYQNKQALTWKAEAYQGVSSKLVGFADKFLSYSSKTNMTSASFFDGSSVRPLGKKAEYFTASGDVKAAKDLSITNINSLAKAASYNNTYQATNNTISTGELVFGDQMVSNLAGETINISYNGQMFDVTLGEDLAPNASARDIAQAFNDAVAKIDMDTKTQGIQALGDKISMSLEDGDKFKIYATDIDDKNTFYIAGGTKKAIDALNIEMGINGRGNKDLVGSVFDAEKFTSKINFNEALKNQSITFDFNGMARTIKFDENIDFQNMNEFATFLQGKFDSAVGANKIKVGSDGDKMTLEVLDPTSKLAYMGSSGANITGFKGVLNLEKYDTTKVNVAKNLEDLKMKEKISTDGVIKVNGQEFSYKSTDSLKSIIEKINSSPEAGVTLKYLETSNSFSIVSDETGVQGKVDIEDVSGNLAKAMFGKAKVDNTDPGYNGGQDASISFKIGDGSVQTMTRSNNSFDINGLTLKLTDKAVVGDISTEPVRFETTADTKSIVDSVREMIDAYNEIVELANKELSTKKNRNYAPLTDEQKESMSEAQIKVWEDKAKAGILFGDSELRNLTTEMRFAFSFDVPGLSSFADMGISTSSSYKDNGKLIFDEKKFTKALEERPEVVKDAFTRSENKTPGADKNDAGVMTRMKLITDKFARTTGEKGSLIKLAGLPNSLTLLDSSISKQIDEIDKTIIRLNKTLLSEEDRYYRQFTALERLTAQMNAQSGWLTQQTQG